MALDGTGWEAGCWAVSGTSQVCSVSLDKFSCCSVMAHFLHLRNEEGCSLLVCIYGGRNYFSGELGNGCLKWHLGRMIEVHRERFWP